jgi:UDP-glucose 4-epimerase
VTDDLADLFSDRARRVDCAMHLAWNVDPLRDSERQRAICIGGTNRFLDGCVAGDVRHVFFMSSGTAYGANPRHASPVDEAEPFKLEHHFQYSAEKGEAERLCSRFAADRPGTLLQIARPCVVGGPNVDNFIFRAMDRPVTFRAIGHDPEIQLVHEDDTADALLAIIDSRRPGAFNVAGEGTMRLSEAYRRIGARVVALPLPALRAVARAAWKRDIRAVTEAPEDFLSFVVYPWLVSSRRLRDELGFRFRYDTAQTLDAFVASRGRASARPESRGERAVGGRAKGEGVKTNGQRAHAR